MRNDQLTKQILELLRRGYTQKDIAFELKKHKNTIWRHVKRIREEQVYSVRDMVNRIDDKLIHELNEMKHRDLINYRRILLPPEEPKPEGEIRYEIGWPEIDNGEADSTIQGTSKTETIPQEQS